MGTQQSRPPTQRPVTQEDLNQMTQRIDEVVNAHVHPRELERQADKLTKTTEAFEKKAIKKPRKRGSFFSCCPCTSRGNDPARQPLMTNSARR